MSGSRLSSVLSPPSASLLPSPGMTQRPSWQTLGAMQSLLLLHSSHVMMHDPDKSGRQRMHATARAFFMTPLKIVHFSLQDKVWRPKASRPVQGWRLLRP
jgi:hypothetical protein